MLRTELSRKPCWRVGLYLGSMLYFDFGEKTPGRTSRGDELVLGEVTIGVRDVYWTASKDGVVLSDSDVASRKDVDGLSAEFLGVTFADLNSTKQALRFSFSKGIDLTIDKTNTYDTDTAIVEVSTLRHYITVSPRGQLFLDPRPRPQHPSS